MKKTVAVLLASMAFLPFSANAASTINLSATDFSASTATQSFAPGSYVVSLVSDVYKAWAPATPAAGNWTDYYKYTINGTTSFFNPLNSARYSTADAAFAAYGSAPQLQLNFTTPTSVTFGIADGQFSFGDNSGGVSLSVAAVPEPATWAMMIAGFGAIGYGMRSRRRVAIRTALA